MVQTGLHYTKTWTAVRNSTCNKLVVTDYTWTTDVYPVPTAANQPQVLVKFTVTNGYGNNIWVDNVNLGGPTSIAKGQLCTMSLSGVNLYPNPALNVG